MHEKIWAVALLAGFVIGTAPASAADKAMPLVTKKNWHNHPAIVDIRKLFQANDADLKTGKSSKTRRRWPSGSRAPSTKPYAG